MPFTFPSYENNKPLSDRLLASFNDPFTSGFSIEPVNKDSFIINRQEKLDIRLCYKNIEGLVLPQKTLNDIYPNCIFKFGIYSI